MKAFKQLAVALAVAATSLSALAGPVIDEFTVNQSFLKDQSTGGTGWATEAGSAGETSIIGGFRDLFVTRAGGPADNDVGLGNGMIVSGGTLSYLTDPGTYGLGYIRWDGDTAAYGAAATAQTEAQFNATLNPTGLGGKNLDDFADAFELTVNESDLGFTFALQVFTSATEWTMLVLQSQDHNVPTTSLISFADFYGAANENGTVLGSGALRYTGSGGSADLRNVGALQAIINPGALSTMRIDLVIDSARTVPEPATLALAGLALVGAGVARRRRRACANPLSAKRAAHRLPFFFGLQRRSAQR